MRALSDIASDSAVPSPAPGFCDLHPPNSPIPVIGIYIAAAALVCFFCMTFDLVHGILCKKSFLPCKLFYMNAFTMTVLGVATKIPVDLTTGMPRAEDQLSKLTSTALLCTSIGFYMPSLGTMDTSERYGNLAALSVVTITIVVNLFMQMVTCVIFEFKIHLFIIIVCVLVLLLLMWSSAIAFRGQTELWPSYYRSRPSLDPNNTKDVQGLRKLLLKFHVLNYTGNPQTLLCETSHNHTVAFLCALSSAVALEATLSSFSKFGGSESSDYKWSIPYIIVAQLLAIVVGSFSIIYRWLSFVIHTDENVLWAHKHGYSPERELEHLKLKTLSFRFLGKSLSNVFLVAKDFIMDLLIHTQIALYTCSSCFIGFPIYTFKNLFQFINLFDDIFHKHTEDIDNMLNELSTAVSEISWDFALSSQLGDPFNTWISIMAMKDMMSWTNKCKRRDHPDKLIDLISEYNARKSEISILENLEAKGEAFFEKFGEDEVQYKYRVSCVSVLVLSGMLAELMPSPRKESLNQSLNESFEIIYYVDRNNTQPSMGDEIRWTSTKELWAQWENFNHWFRTKIISRAFNKRSEENADGAIRVLKDALGVIDKDFGDAGTHFNDMKDAGSLASKHEDLIAAEFVIISKFIGVQGYESDEDLFDFLEKCYIEMICDFLSRLPLAILKEIDEDDPTEIGEDRVRKALKFLAKLELLEDRLGDKIEWSWPIDHERQAHADLTPEAARDCGSEIEAEVSTVVVADAAAAANSAEGDDGDAIRESRSQ